jgi:hypothetical protein
MRIPGAMMPSSLAKLFRCLAFCLLGCSAALGGPACVIAPAAPPDAGPFARGGRELSLTAGFLYSPICATGGRPVFSYAQGDLCLGWMLTDPSPLFGCSLLRGNWEALANVFGAGAAQGPSGFMAGGRALLRYNFVQPGAKWVPFFQIGGGGLGNNIYRHQDQSLIGNGFEFTLVADIGLRYFFTPSWAAEVLVDFEHISNANTASRNVGVNALGGTVGVGWFF